MIVDVTDLSLKKLYFKVPYETSRMSRARMIYYTQDVQIINVDKTADKNSSNRN